MEHRNSPYVQAPALPRRGRIIAALAVVCAGVAALVLVFSSRGGDTVWLARFGTSGLVTNELAYSHPDRPGVVSSPDWVVTSGSLFADQGAGWTGPVDARTPDLDSRTSTGSAVFRAVSRRADFRDVSVSFDLDVAGTTTTARTGTHAYDGVHVFLRYTSPQSLYAVSVDRRDGTVAIKIKTPGGPSNGGDYTTLAQAPLDFTAHQWVHEKVTIVNEGSGVRITLFTEGHQVLSALSNGTGAGRVGLRGDNTAFRFRNFTVSKA